MKPTERKTPEPGTHEEREMLQRILNAETVPAKIAALRLVLRAYGEQVRGEERAPLRFIEAAMGLHVHFSALYAVDGYVVQIENDSAQPICSGEGETLTEAVKRLAESIEYLIITQGGVNGR
jgi:hypothetical protein